MNGVEGLEQEIRQRLDAAAMRRNATKTEIHLDMQLREEQAAQFEAASTHVIQTVVRPRLSKLTNLFPNARTYETKRQAGYSLICAFEHTVDYPATASVTVSISTDWEMQKVILSFRVEIIPVFVRPPEQDECLYSLDSVDDDSIASWLDANVIKFVDTYLQLGELEQYQRENIVTDPVCGMRINRRDAEEQVDFDGRTYYFCVPECKSKFLVDPPRYAVRRK
jgi:YHS domain-containing protein